MLPSRRTLKRAIFVLHGEQYKPYIYVQLLSTILNTFINYDKVQCIHIMCSPTHEWCTKVKIGTWFFSYDHVNYIVNLCFRPTSQPTHSEKTVSLTRVPGAPPHLHSRPLRPRTAPGPYSSTTSKPPTSASSSQQPPSSKSSITSVAVPSDSLQQTATEDSGPLLEEKEKNKILVSDLF